MVAVLLVFANHLFGWPRGGFTGVDVFFVISGFLITGNLLRMVENSGNVSFRKFYWNRVRRIVPAATVVLILSYVASLVVFLPFRAHKVGLDALFAFIFMANWRFASQNTDYFASSATTASPIQHYWSLSIEEQFYFVWPAVIFLISLFILRKIWTHSRRMLLAGTAMGFICAASLWWALYETATSATWAYFNTFARVWELGIGALLAIAVGKLAQIPSRLKPLLSWAGLALICASVVLIADNSHGFPAPWALLPVTGAALVVAAGVNGEPSHQEFLRNPVSVYIGDISYSLYLVHWPVIVILGGTIGAPYFAVAAAALSFGLAIACYHFVENPMRRITYVKVRATLHQIRHREYRPQRSSQYAAVGALALLVVALCAYIERPRSHGIVPEAAASVQLNQSSSPDPELGPLASDLQLQIADALKATEWPALDPSMESVISDLNVQIPQVVNECGGTAPPSLERCTWGSASASTRIMVVGNSVAAYYVEPLRALAENSNGQLQLHTEAMLGCSFANDLIEAGDDSLLDACPGRKQHAMEAIRQLKPEVVVISDNYGPKRVHGTDHVLTASEWSESMRQIIEQFAGSANRIVFLAPPPGDMQIADCYGRRSSKPSDCIGHVDKYWLAMAEAEQNLAKSIGATWIDSRPWFCHEGLCPSFVGSTPTKFDTSHMVAAYGLQIAPVIGESLREAGVL